MTSFTYNPTEKRAAQIVDQLCPVITAETGQHIGPTLFSKLTIRLADMLVDEKQADELIAIIRALIDTNASAVQLHQAHVKACAAIRKYNQ